ncbi:AMP-binding protein [Phytopseudomonas punonensis]|uniref:Long-chain acyl-CoA synthetase (AMP-forming) n=1 Tax=Phytopseudomonas punonensis TaxID=1220495 RepID=A0A1M7FDC0_9GAMM|nr:AMP-binding protein [Pseudomonas punonensis]SHM01699.1 Long-chain acyl-CoA synthetase (AMP-forming) [Pseudomonas punonensis]
MQPELSDFKALLLLHAHCQPSRPALRDDTESIDYAQLWSEIETRKALLLAQPGKTFALIMDNSPQMALWDLAALFAGIPCVTLPPFFTWAQTAHCLAQSGVDLLLTDAPLTDQLIEAGFRQAGGFWSRELPGRERLPSGTAKVTYTSGTTGTPKGVCLSAEALLRVAYELHAASRPAAPKQYLAVLPLAVLLENLGVYAALLAGASVTLLPQQSLGIEGATRVDWPRLLGQLVRQQTQSLILVPQLLLGLIIALEHGQLEASQFHFVAVGGARVSDELLERAAQLNLPLYQGYGLSECASVVCLNTPAYNRIGSVGRPLPHVEVRIAEDGEVWVRGSALLGYLGEAPFTGDWLPTGDIGVLDADGYLFLKGRKKHQFTTSFGRNVNPDWVEAELTQRGVIAQAFVHGEAMDHNIALLWPVDPDCSDEALEHSVAWANIELPDYARVHQWQRLSEPFTPANGLLTSNGRLRREAILARHAYRFSTPVAPKEQP